MLFSSFLIVSPVFSLYSIFGRYASTIPKPIHFSTLASVAPHKEDIGGEQKLSLRSLHVFCVGAA
jgi:hypothetical protein